MKHRKHMLFTAVMVAVVAFCLCACLEESPKAGSDWPLVGYDFGGNFTNWAGSEFDAVSYGNLAFTNKGIYRKGIELVDGYLGVRDSRKIKFENGFTISMWVKMTDFSSYKPMLFSRESTDGDMDNGPITVHFSEEYNYLRTDVTFVMKNNEIKTYSFASGFLFEPGTLENRWHHIAISFQNDSLSYYLDGALTSTESLPEEIKGYKSIANSVQDFTLGRGSNGNLHCTMDEVRIYDQGLDEAQMKEIYDEIFSRFEHQLVLKKDSKEIWFDGVQAQGNAETRKDEASGRVMVPLRTVVESMGGTLYWDGNDGMGRVDIYVNDNNISLWMYDTNAMVGQRHVKMDAYPLRINEITMVPVRFVAEELGALVDWKEDTEEVILRF